MKRINIEFGDIKKYPILCKAINRDINATDFKFIYCSLLDDIIWEFYFSNSEYVYKYDDPEMLKAYMNFNFKPSTHPDYFEIITSNRIRHYTVSGEMLFINQLPDELPEYLKHYIKNGKYWNIY